jgi:3-oxoadipate enol-lactonase
MMDWIDAGGVALRYDLIGSGAKTLVLVHEMGGMLESWDYVLPDLARDRRVCSRDRRRSGGKACAGCAATNQSYA